jgi:hypothetical protein
MKFKVWDKNYKSYKICEINFENKCGETFLTFLKRNRNNTDIGEDMEVFIEDNPTIAEQKYY